MDNEGNSIEVIRPIEKAAGRVYAIGDIHGCAQELEALLHHLKKSSGLTTEDLVVFIGDYIDRGPDSKGVIDLILELRASFPNLVCLKGNHEDMFLDFLGFEGQMGDSYLPNGGRECLASYGVDLSLSGEEVCDQMPQEHVDFLTGLEAGVSLGNYVFVHAGVNPLQRLDQQTGNDLFWIRSEFISNIHRFDKTIVFGHTPYHDVLFHLPFKLGIDTGLVYGNKLSCIELTKKELIQIDRGDKKPKVKSIAERFAVTAPA